MNLALIGTFHKRYENTLPLLIRVLKESTHVPEEVWLLCEDEEDMGFVTDAVDDLKPETAVRAVQLPTPRVDGRYRVIPYSHKINWALGQTKANAVTYLDNNSMPSIDKYKAIVDGLEQNPDWGCVYVTQERTGFAPLICTADEVVECGAYRLNYTQLAHRRTADRWPLDMRYADPDIADAMFMVLLAKSLGPVFPVGGLEVQDFHHIPSPAAAGIN